MAEKGSGIELITCPVLQGDTPAARLKALEEENSRLKRQVADLSLDNQILKEVNSKKW